LLFNTDLNETGKIDGKNMEPKTAANNSNIPKKDLIIPKVQPPNGTEQITPVDTTITDVSEVFKHLEDLGDVGKVSVPHNDADNSFGILASDNRASFSAAFALLLFIFLCACATHYFNKSRNTTYKSVGDDENQLEDKLGKVRYSLFFSVIEIG
jgi:hypothetical protein